MNINNKTDAEHDDGALITISWRWRSVDDEKVLVQVFAPFRCRRRMSGRWGVQADTNHQQCCVGGWMNGGKPNTRRECYEEEKADLREYLGEDEELEEGNLMIDCVERCGRTVIIIFLLFTSSSSASRQTERKSPESSRETVESVRRRRCCCSWYFWRILYLVRGKRNSPTNKLLLRIILRIFYRRDAMGGYYTCM